MSADFLLKVASILETVATQTETQIVEKVASEKTARATILRDLAERYNAATGEELDVEKMATFDDAAFETVRTLVEKTAGAVSNADNLGSPGEMYARRPPPRTTKEAAAAASDAFARWALDS